MNIQEAYELHRSGQLEAAESAYRSILIRDPHNADANNLLGMILKDSEREGESLAYFETAVALSPKSIPFLLNQAEVLARLGRLGDAETSFEKAAALEESGGVAHARFGLYLAGLERFSQALPLLERSVEMSPNNAAFITNYGNVLRRMGKLEAAIIAFEEAMKLTPHDALTANCLGEAYVTRGLALEAEGAFRTAIANRPNYAKAHGNLGILLHREGRLTEAKREIEEAIQWEPQAVSHYANLAALMRDAADAGEAAQLFQKLLESGYADAAVISKFLYTLNFVPGLSEQQIVELHVALSERLFPSKPEGRAFAPSEGKPICIGFVSGDFWAHSVAFFLLPLYESLDRSRFRVVSISETPAPDRMTAKFQEFSDAWIDSRGKTSDEVAVEIAAEGVDVLIDLSGYTGGGRLDVVAASNAPLRLSWLGYPSKTGAACIDGRIVDGITDPEGSSLEGAGEGLLRLEEAFLCYAPREDLPPVAPLPAAAAGCVTFGSFNNAAKLNADVIGLWASVLKAVPGSRLVLKSWQYRDEAFVENLKLAFEARGVSREGLQFFGRIASYKEHLDLYGMVDIALDTFPYNGTTTTCEALAMGVPTLAIEGNRHASRVGMSLMSHVGLRDWIAGDATDFVAKAVEKARDLEFLSGLRLRLRERLASSPLGDAAGFARRFEALVRRELERKAKLGGS